MNHLKNNYRFDGIEVLRFLAALMVVVTHSFAYTSKRLGAEEILWSTGEKGVDIFFVISGFVMVISSRNLIDSSDGWLYFLKKRLIRIVPHYWLATTFKVIIFLLLSGLVVNSELDWWFIIKSYFFVPSIDNEGSIRPFLGVGWTLIFEMFFYVIFTISLFLRINIYLFVGVVLFVFSVLSIFRGDVYSPWWYLMDSIILEFYMGMLIGYFTLKNKFVPSLLSVILLFLSLVYLLFSNNALNLPRVVEFGIPAAMLVWSTISLEKYIQGKVPSAILFYGAASYSLYLFHSLLIPIVPEVLKKLGIGSFSVSVLVCVMVALIAGAIIHRLFDKHIINIFRKKIPMEGLGNTVKVT